MVAWVEREEESFYLANSQEEALKPVDIISTLPEEEAVVDIR